MWEGMQHAPHRAVPRGWVCRETSYVDRPPGFWAYQNLCAVPSEPQDPVVVESHVREAKGARIAVGVNVSVPFENLEGWGKNSVAAERAGADFLEINVSCPYIPGRGLEIGRDPEKVRTIVKAVKQRVRIPAMVKLNAGVFPENLMAVATACEDAGADGISISNTIYGFVGVDIESGMPLPAYVDVEGELRGVSTGLSGPAIKPLVLASVARLAQTVKVPICAIGGITDWQSAVEAIMLGATMVQLCTAVMLYGYRVGRELNRGLQEFMARKGYKSLQDLVGITNKRYSVGKVYTSSAEKQPRTMVVDEVLCDGCGRCVPACEASGDGAIKVTDGVAAIDQDLCLQCNSCMIVCPRQAISSVWEPAVLRATELAQA